ncbi:MAG: DUF4190 domain-containing protein [Roseibacillus sp.]
MWFYAKDGEQHGPVEADDIRSRLKSGDLSNGTLVWREGMAQWSPLGEVLELREPVPVSGEGSQGSSAESSSAASAVATNSSDPYVAPAVSQLSQPAPQLIAPVQQNTMALVSMILGILSIVLCSGLLTGIPAIICGHMARKQFRESPTPQSGEGMATTGLILGYIATVLSILGIIAYVALIVFAVTAAPSASSPVFTPTP